MEVTLTEEELIITTSLTVIIRVSFVIERLSILYRTAHFLSDTRKKKRDPGNEAR